MRLILFILLIFAPLLLTACEISTGPVEVSAENGFSVLVASNRLILRNESAHRIHYVAVAESESPLIDLAPPDTWPSFAPHTEVRIPFTEMIGYQPGERAAVVFWCTLQVGECGELRVRW